MPKRADLTGQAFHRLTVVSPASDSNAGKARWNCVCECGRASVKIGAELRSGKAKSCGCMLLDGSIRRTHGNSSTGARTTEYRVWCNMKNRCGSTTNKQWKDYGGRGITVCDRWKKFENFYADMGVRPDGLTLDRINNDLGYSPENCRWADRVTQRRNSRGHVVLIDVSGEKMLMTDAVKRHRVVSYATAVCRVHRGWSPDDAVTTPYTRCDNKGYREAR